MVKSGKYERETTYKDEHSVRNATNALKIRTHFYGMRATRVDTFSTERYSLTGIVPCNANLNKEQQ